MQTRKLHRLIVAAPILAGAALLQAYPAMTTAAGEPAAREITLELGDYRFHPDSIEVEAGTPVILHLKNRDRITPHNFTLQDAAAGLDISSDVSAGSTVDVEFTPLKAGSFTFYCNKKLLFMKSHRDRGMKGTLVVHSAAPDSP